MVTLQVELSEQQAAAVRRIALSQGVAEAEVIRRVVDRIIASEPLPDRREIQRRALAAIGSVPMDVADLSTRHDDYLAEAFGDWPRR